MPSRSKRKGNPDIDKDGYPGPLAKTTRKKRGAGSSDPKIQDAEALVFAAEDELQGLIKGGNAPASIIQEYKGFLAEAKAALKRAKAK